MNRSSTLSAVVVVGCLVVGCLGAVLSGCKDDKKPDETPPTPSVTASVSATPVASASSAVIIEDDTQTEEDFEEEADTSITEKNIEDELTKIEGELK